MCLSSNASAGVGYSQENDTPAGEGSTHGCVPPRTRGDLRSEQVRGVSQRQPGFVLCVRPVDKGSNHQTVESALSLCRQRVCPLDHRDGADSMV